MASNLFRRLLSSSRTREKKRLTRQQESRDVRRRPFLELLEERRMMATLSEAGSQLIVTLDLANESLGISSSGSSYTLTSTAFRDNGITPGRVTFAGTTATVTGN